MVDLLVDLRQSIEALRHADPGSSIELLLDQMETTSARLLRLCAIPHQFTPAIIQVLMPGLEGTQAEEHFQAFSQLPLIILRENERAIHDETRTYLFRQWLKKDHLGEFAAASSRLATFFRDHLESTQGEQYENLQRQYMFHVFAVNQDNGLREFKRIWSEQYSQYRLVGCQTLINLVREYNPVLTPAHRSWISYFEAVLATDQFQLSEAEAMLKAILDDPEALPDVDLRVRTLQRLGHVSRRRSDWSGAIGYLVEALDRSRTEPGIDETYRLLHDLGVVYRELGEVDKANTMFEESLKGAEEAGDALAVATSYNGLGTLCLKISNFTDAVTFYEKALVELTIVGDRFRFAQVYNNLGMAYSRLGNWEKSREYYEKSLKIKEDAGDTCGQAMTLNNLSAIYQMQGDLVKALTVGRRSSELFLEIRDIYNAALAKSNLGRLYRKTGDTKLSDQLFSEAVDLFETCHEPGQAEEIRKDISSATAKVPWWIWIFPIMAAIAIVALLLMLLLITTLR